MRLTCRLALTLAGLLVCAAPAQATVNIKITGKLVRTESDSIYDRMQLVLRNEGDTPIEAIRMQLGGGQWENVPTSGPEQIDCTAASEPTDTYACPFRQPWKPPTQLFVNVETKKGFPDG